MTLYFADLVREASWGTGTADLPLGGALPGHRRFADAVPPGARFHYCIAGVTHPDEWETGEGELGSGGTLVRLPLASSAAGATVDFSPGLKTVALTVAADWFAARDGGVAAIADVAGLQAALDGKAGEGHGHAIEEVDGLETALAGRQPLDPGLTALAAVSISPFGRDLLALADAEAARGTLGVSATGADPAYARRADNLSDLASISTARANLGLGSIATQAASDYALLSGAAFTGPVSSTGRVTAGQQLRATGYATPPAGNGVDFGFSAGKGFMQAFNSGTATVLPLRIIGSNVEIDPGGVNAATFSSAGLAVTGSVSAGGIELGYRDLPRVTGTLERGKCLAASAGVTIASGPAAGSSYAIYNDSGAAITLSQGSGLTLRLAGTASAGNRTLAARGFATIWFNSPTEAVISGAGVS